MSASSPEAGVHYPSSYAEFRAWFPDDAACLDYLDWLRWAEGFVCPHCSATKCWMLSSGIRRCAGCRRRISVTTGTIFDKTRTPLTVWFAAAWFVTSQKSGASALGLQRVLGVGSYQTAWAMLHRFRTAMVRPGRDMLHGDVEVDESFLGGVKPGKRGRGAAGKVLVAIAVEQATPKGFGRARIEVIPNAQAPTLRRFLLRNVAPGSVIITDGLKSYPAAVGNTYTHKPLNVKGSGQRAHVLLPGVHRIAALVKRWLLGIHQGAVEAGHVQAYLNEYCFRFNRRSSRSRGLLFYRLLELSVVAAPATYRSLVKNPAPKLTKPTAPSVRGHPGSLAVGRVRRPWRRAS